MCFSSLFLFRDPSIKQSSSEKSPSPEGGWAAATTEGQWGTETKHVSTEASGEDTGEVITLCNHLTTSFFFLDLELKTLYLYIDFRKHSKHRVHKKNET